MSGQLSFTIVLGIAFCSQQIIKEHFHVEDLWSKVGGGGYEPKMVAHICSMFRIYLELHLKLLLKQLKVSKKVRLGVKLCLGLRLILSG